MEFAAALTVIAVDAAVELQHPAAAGGLMKAVDVLCDDGGEAALLLPLGQLVMGGIGLCMGREEFCPVKPEKLFGVAFVKGMA